MIRVRGAPRARLTEETTRVICALKERFPPMQATLRMPFARPTANESVGPRPPLSALGKLTAAASIGIAGLLVYMMATIFREFPPPMIVFAVVALAAAGAIARGWRWAPALGAVVSL